MIWGVRLLVLVFVLAACSAVPDTAAQSETATATSDAEAWLSTGEDFAALIRWTEGEPERATGVLQLARLEGFDVVGQSWPVEGLVGGGDVTLNVDGLFGSSTLTGDLSGGRLTLYVPDESGSLNVLRFERATIADYNEAVDKLRAEGSNQAVLHEQAELATSAISDADRQLGSARSSLERSIEGFDYARDWAGYSIEAVEFALDSLRDAVLQLEASVATDPELAELDLEWVEDSYAFLGEEADYALGPGGVGVIKDSIAQLRTSIREMDAAILHVNEVEDLYLSSESAPYDASAEKALIRRAQSIIDTTGPAAVTEHERQVEEMLNAGAALAEEVRSLFR